MVCEHLMLQYKSKDVCVFCLASVEILKNIFQTYENELMVLEVCKKTLQKRERLTGRCQEKNSRIHSQSSVGIQRSLLASLLTEVGWILFAWLIRLHLDSRHCCLKVTIPQYFQYYQCSSSALTTNML